MPYRANYPATVAEILDDNMKFKPAALAAVRSLARSRPWRGSEAERIEKLRRCNTALSAAYGITEPALTCYPDRDLFSGGSHYMPASHAIIMCGRLSVVTFLHEFAHARGFDERQAVRWSVNLFRRCFPRSFARCRQVAHTLIAEGR